MKHFTKLIDIYDDNHKYKVYKQNNDNLSHEAYDNHNADNDDSNQKQIFRHIIKSCNYLSELNKLLPSMLPNECYINLCHFGAINYDTKTIVLFVNNQQIFHIIRNLSNHILKRLNDNHHEFDRILIKNKISKIPYQFT